jgi:LPS-assembly lipoprotein
MNLEARGARHETRGFRARAAALAGGLRRCALRIRAFPSRLIPRTSYLPAVVALLCIATTAGCGFQLRGQAQIPFKTLMVESAGYSDFVNDLERAIASGSQTRVVQAASEAEAVLKIVGETREKQILSLSTAGRVSEFELRYRVAYRLLGQGAQDIIPPGELRLRRDMTYDDTAVLAKESEEALLYRDMRTDAVRQMLRRLSLAKPAAQPPG